MRTYILAWVIVVLGLLMIVGGLWGVVAVAWEPERTPLKSYGGAFSMICGGVAMLGVAQALRLLMLALSILVHGSPVAAIH